jgi:phosphotransferase system HPr (HPr) family protein
MKIQKVTVYCEEGLHLRVASQVARIAQRSGGTVQIRNKKERPHANACSVLELLTLDASRGTSLEIVTDCPNDDDVLDKLTEVFNQRETA